MKSSCKNLLIITFICLFILPTASAEPYIGLNLGKGNIDGYEEANSGFIYLGYDMGYFAVEGGITPLGYYEHSTLDANIQIEGYEIDVLGQLKMGNRFTAYAKLGYYNYTVKPKVFGTPLSTMSGDTITYGLGVMMNISQTLKARLAYEVYDDVENLKVDRLVIGLSTKIF